MRRKWSRVLERVELEPPSSDHAAAFPEVDVDVQDEDDRRDTFELLNLGVSHDAEHVLEALRAGRHDSGRFVPPLELFHGTLSFSFDELEELKATVTMASPYAAADKRLRGLVEEARLFLDNRNMRSSPEWTRAHTSRIDDALARHDAISMSTLDKQRQRALLEQRCYRTCRLFAAEQLHARLLPAKEGSPAVPAYVPAELANKLPMFEQLRCKLIAEVHPRSSQFEEHPGALRVVALGYLWD